MGKRNYAFLCRVNANPTPGPGLRWLPLFATTFLGVFGANYLKLLIITIGVNWMAAGEDNHSLIVSMTSALFFVSYIFFSPLAGRLAKVMLKRKVILYIRIVQFPVYLLACFGFWIHSLPVVLVCMFLIGFTSAIYGPSKYGLIRDIGGVKGISFGTGTLEMLTFFGNILGPFAASLIADHYSFTALVAVMCGSALLNFFVVLTLKAEEGEPLHGNRESINPVRFLINSYRWAKNYGKMNLIVLGLAMFWMMDAVLQMNLFVHCPETLGMSYTGMSIVMTIALVGIGLGSFLAGLLSRGKVMLILTPVGGFGMALSLAVLTLFNPQNVVFFTVLIFLTAAFSGVFMVPLSASIQARVEGRKQSDMLAYSNFVTFLLLFLASALFGLIADFLGTHTVFMFLLACSILITWALITSLPELQVKHMKEQQK